MFSLLAGGNTPSGVSTGSTQTTLVPITTTVVCPLTEGMSFQVAYENVRFYFFNQRQSIRDELILADVVSI